MDQRLLKMPVKSKELHFFTFFIADRLPGERFHPSLEEIPAKPCWIFHEERDKTSDLCEVYRVWDEGLGHSRRE